MKVLPYSCIQDLAPDGYEQEEPLYLCQCGHEQDWHEQIGPFYECLGACEAEGCPCGAFEQEEYDGL